MTSPLETVQEFFAAMGQGPAGAEAMAAVLSEDMTFRGPILKADSRAEFLAGMADFDTSVGEMKVRTMFCDQQQVCVVYDFVLRSGTVTNVQLFTVVDGLITAQELVFNLPEFQAAAS